MFVAPLRQRLEIGGRRFTTRPTYNASVFGRRRLQHVRDFPVAAWVAMLRVRADRRLDYGAYRSRTPPLTRGRLTRVMYGSETTDQLVTPPLARGGSVLPATATRLHGYTATATRVAPNDLLDFANPAHLGALNAVHSVPRRPRAAPYRRLWKCRSMTRVPSVQTEVPADSPPLSP